MISYNWGVRLYKDFNAESCELYEFVAFILTLNGDLI